MTNKEAIKQINIYIYSEFENMPAQVVESLQLAIKALESSSWIPITTRELTDEEKEEHPDITFVWTCPIPDDAQDVLVFTSWGDIKIVTFCSEYMGSYFDEMDEDDVLAWMPLPEPYTKEEQS